MSLYPLYEVMDNIQIIATNEEGVEFIQALQVSKENN